VDRPAGDPQRSRPLVQTTMTRHLKCIVNESDDVGCFVDVSANVITFVYAAFAMSRHARPTYSVCCMGVSLWMVSLTPGRVRRRSFLNPLSISRSPSSSQVFHRLLYITPPPTNPTHQLSTMAPKSSVASKAPASQASKAPAGASKAPAKVSLLFPRPT